MWAEHLGRVPVADPEGGGGLRGGGSAERQAHAAGRGLDLLFPEGQLLLSGLGVPVGVDVSIEHVLSGGLDFVRLLDFCRLLLFLLAVYNSIRLPNRPETCRGITR